MTDCLLVDALALSKAIGGVLTPLIGAFAILWEGAGDGYALGPGDPAMPASDGREWVRILRVCSSSRLERNDIGQWRLIASSDGAYPRVDLGGVAKGGTTDHLRDLAVDTGAGGVLASAETLSFAAWGTRTSGTPWRIGLRDTIGGMDDWAGSVPLRGGALSTSGIPDGTSCPPSHRIVDPRTGVAPTLARRPVSVLCASGVMAEVLSTAILVAGTEYVNEETLRRWAHRRGMNAGWEWVVIGDSGVQAPAGAGWTPRAGSAHEVRRGAARQAETVGLPSTQKRHEQASPSPPGLVMSVLRPWQIVAGAAACLVQQRPVVFTSRFEGGTQPRRSSREVGVVLGSRPVGPGRPDPPGDLSGA